MSRAAELRTDPVIDEEHPMTGHLPPVPPAARTDKGPMSSKPGDVTDQSKDLKQQDFNTAERGRQGNIKQNTTHQGHQQDR